MACLLRRRKACRNGGSVRGQRAKTKLRDGQHDKSARSSRKHKELSPEFATATVFRLTVPRRGSYARYRSVRRPSVREEGRTRLPQKTCTAFFLLVSADTEPI